MTPRRWQLAKKKTNPLGPGKSFALLEHGKDILLDDGVDLLSGLNRWDLGTDNPAKGRCGHAPLLGKASDGAGEARNHRDGSFRVTGETMARSGETAEFDSLCVLSFKFTNLL